MRKYFAMAIGAAMVGTFGLAGCGSSSAASSASPDSAPVSSQDATPVAGIAHTTAPAAPLLAVVSPAQEGPCTITDQYEVGNHIVFRIQVLDPTTGRQMTDQNLSNVSIVLPNGQALKATYNTHEGSTQKFWVAHWTVPRGYPTGAVNYTVRVQGSNRPVHEVQFKVPDKNAHLTIVP